MQGIENLYYALGELVYAVAKADGHVQQEEKKKLHDIVVREAALHKNSIDISEIIFHVLEKSNLNFETAYSWAIKEMRKYKYYLTADLKIEFAAIVEKVAHAFDSVTVEERDIVERFRADLKTI